MRALICRSFGDLSNLEVGDLPDPQPGAGQILIRVRACGVNFPDTLIVQGKYQFKPDLPFAPGAEVAGEIVALGQDVSDFMIGERVVAVALWGGMAELMVVEASAATRLPDGADIIRAASFLMAHGTAHHALFDRGQLAASDTLLVLGAGGGVGLAAVELGARHGARVIAAASSAEKLARCREQGAHEVINLSTENLRDRVKELTGGHGVDVCVDPIGGDVADAAIRSMAWRGRYLVVGFAAGTIPTTALNLPLLKGCSIIGVFWGSYKEREPQAASQAISDLLTDLDAGRVDPAISEVVPLERAVEALRAMHERRAVGKLVVSVP